MLRPCQLFASVALALCALTAPAVAAPCAGFNDVDDTSPFCPNVEWLKNRGITLGCTTTAYCPVDPVSRIAMAAFMNRLGNALTPLAVRVEASPGAIDLDAGAVTCTTSDIALAGFPRRAYADAVLSGTAAPAQADFALDLVLSLDGGASWTSIAASRARGGVPANGWGMLAALADVDLAVPTTVRFGVRPLRDGLAGTADLIDSRCSLRVLIVSRTASASPY